MTLRHAIEMFVDTHIEDYQQAALAIHAAPETSGPKRTVNHGKASTEDGTGDPLGICSIGRLWAN